MNMTEIPNQFPSPESWAYITCSAEGRCDDGNLYDGNLKLGFRHDYAFDPILYGRSDDGNNNGNYDDGNPSLEREERGLPSYVAAV